MQPQQLDALLQALPRWDVVVADSMVVPQSSSCEGADLSIWMEGTGA